MRYLKTQFSFLNENNQSAKDFLLKTKKEEIFNDPEWKKENPDLSFSKLQLTPEQEREALSDGDYGRVKNYFEGIGKPGLIFPWLYFVKEGLPFSSPNITTEQMDWESPDFLTTVETLSDMYEKWNSQKGNSTLSFGSIDKLIKENQEKKRNNPSGSVTPAYEVLRDELIRIMPNMENEKIIKNYFPQILKEYYKKQLSPSNTSRTSKETGMYNAFHSRLTNLRQIPRKPGEIIIRDFETGEEKQRYPNQSLFHVIKKLGKYKGDRQEYAHFKDKPEVCFVDLLKEMKEQLEISGKPIQQTLQEIESFEPYLKVLHMDEDIIITISRNQDGVKKVCSLSNTGLCTREGNFFHLEKYKDSIHVHFNQLSLDPSSWNYFLSCHLKKNLEIFEFANSFNKPENQEEERIKPRTLEEFIEVFEIPEKYYQIIKEKLPAIWDDEMSIRSVMKLIYSHNNSKDNKFSKIYLLGRLEVFQKKEIENIDMDHIYKIVLELIAQDENLSKKEIYDYLTEKDCLFTYGDYLVYKYSTPNIPDLNKVIELFENGKALLDRLLKTSSNTQNILALKNNLAISLEKVKNDPS